ncbi:NAD-dependent epimerase/dehydratase family protein [Actinomadura sp. HBU206391]|uniref:NAD-dependent epimerase/dehydratase family protein n=1 Tax=Actinomadura sp. HBU206391 TaxID=2731692 RepID=UPI00164F0AD7|nr:NAD-dependent epimerase/dehydratase family protein [Actinomadura sp. HBU206391]MBC6462593.1 NAD-dependent epimerase/dehydratase family protein [Actinomadura sp. HBU206391]
MSLSVLFIGGTGVISSACVDAAVRAGMDVTTLNRGNSATRPVPDAVESLRADVRDAGAVRRVLAGRRFDAVADFLTFTAEQARANVKVFSGRAGQFLFISSASAYQTPPQRLPVVESTPLRNPMSQYSRDKIACEELLTEAYRTTGFPVTIVRPSHTYDPTHVPLMSGWTDVERMRRGHEVVVHGDGTSLWTLTHHTDFATAFTGLLGNPLAVGDGFHITSDEVLSWNQIYELMGSAAGAKPRLVHVPSDTIAAVEPELSAPLLGDKTHSMVFDNTKIKRLVPGWTARTPFSEGARQIVAWHDADPRRKTVDRAADTLWDGLIAAMAKVR